MFGNLQFHLNKFLLPDASTFSLDDVIKGRITYLAGSSKKITVNTMKDQIEMHVTTTDFQGSSITLTLLLDIAIINKYLSISVSHIRIIETNLDSKASCH